MRIVVIGTSGVGKSTFARALAQARGLPYVELDALFWLPDWTPRSRDDFRDHTLAATQGPAWVADGNYSTVRDLLWPRATHIVWLNFGRLTVYSRIVRRTLRRVITREELWAGNRESWRKAFFSRQSIILWSLRTFGKNRRRYAALQAEPAEPR